MIRGAIDGLAAPGARERLAAAVVRILLFAALHGAFRYLSRRGLLVTARKAERRVRRRLFSHVIRLPLSFFGRTPTGDVMSRMTNDLNAVWLFLGPGLLTLIGTVISYVLALVFMLRISVPLTLVAVAMAPAMVLVSREYGKTFHRLHRKTQESLAGMNAFLQEDISGIRLVKSYGMEEVEGARFGAACRDYYDRNLDVSRAAAAFHGLIGFLAGAGVALVLLVGGWLTVKGRLSLGGFVAFSAYLAMLSFPTMALGWVINLFQRGNSAMGRINEFLALPVEEPGTPGEIAPPAPAGEPLLLVRDLSFSYGEEGRGEALRDLSFRVSPGEIVGIVGRTGSGKSTLLSLLLLLREAPRGTVFLRGRDVLDIPLVQLRRSMAWVGQDPFLFSDTLLENVCFGADAPDRDAAVRAIARARIGDEIGEMPDGMDTVIGERGISLSGGQKQRVAIARALCTGADLLLLDDALSAVDAETEQELFRELLEGRSAGGPGMAILFSTHRMASLSRCDRIIVLAAGRLVEQGTHEELFALRGEYYRLYARQMLSRELDASP